MKIILLTFTVFYLAGCSTAPTSAPTTENNTERQEEVATYNTRLDALEKQMSQLLALEPSITRLSSIESELKTLISQLNKMNQTTQENEAPLNSSAKVTPAEKTSDIALVEEAKIEVFEVKQPAATEKSPYSMQLYSLKSKSLLNNSWQALLTRHKDILKEYQPIYEEVVVNNNTYFRLKLGMFNSMNSATTACKPFIENNITCLPSSSSGTYL